ncbi:hypothetical protein VP01_2428g2 [Puccinia sorghi]|uniref:G-patch domain-containing protein n=1 Tax=Puccinia sorghi TaxID=27349 RepID=A0A0L6V762_9BASI|nr:hypothetical protein VP01_2428g2 [Puccinia sorghi]
MGFSASSYLASQGWAGPGTGFTTKSRKKPITLPQKKNLLGIGSDRDTSNPWWDNLFNQVANKLDQPKQQQQQQQQQQQPQSELYRHFQRGNIIPGTNTLESICNQQSTSSTTQQQQEKTDPVVKKKRSNSTLHKSEKRRTVPQEQEEEENSAQTETDKKKKKKKRRSLHPSTPSSNVNIEEGPPKKQKTK